MSQAKVTQEQADAYLDGWGAYHNGQQLKPALANSNAAGNDDLTAKFVEGYEDCAAGAINFDKCMGPHDLDDLAPFVR